MATTARLIFSYQIKLIVSASLPRYSSQKSQSRGRRGLICLWLFWFLLMFFAQGAVSAFPGKIILINESTQHDQKDVSLASNKNDLVVAAWISEGQDGELTGVFARFFEADGFPLTSEFQVNSVYTHLQEEVKVKVGQNDVVAFVWESYWIEKMTSGGISARLFDKWGHPLTSEFQVNQISLGFQGNPDLALDQLNNLVVVWESYLWGEQGVDIFLRKFDSQGNPLIDEIVVNEYQQGDQFSPCLALDKEGNFIVIWNSLSGESGVSGLYVRLFNKWCVPVTSDIKVTSSYYGLNQEAAVIYNEDVDQYIVVWSDYDPEDGGYDIFFQFITKEGKLSGPRLRINRSDGNWNWHPVIASKPRGEFIIAWEKYQPEKNKSDIFFRVFASSGDSLSDEIQVVTDIDEQQQRPAVIFSRPKLWIAWTSKVGADQNIMASIMDLATNLTKVKRKKPNINFRKKYEEISD